MSKRYLYVTIYVILTMMCCRQATIDSASSYVISLDLDKSNYSSTDMSSFYSEIEIIPLESTKDAMIGNKAEFKYFNGNYYVRDGKQNCALVFNKNGKLVYSSKKNMGKGPNEYINCGLINVNQENGNILIMDMLSHVIIEYNLAGDYIKSYEYPKDYVGILSFEKLSEDKFALLFSENLATKRESIIIYDTEKNKVINKFAIFPQMRLHIKTCSVNFMNMNDTIVFNHPYPSNSIYHFDIEGRSFFEKYKLDFGKYNFDPMIIPKNVDRKNHKAFIMSYFEKYAIVFNKFENSSLICFTFFKEHSYFAIFHKNTLKTYIIRNLPHEKGQLISPDAIDEQYAYCLVSPEFLPYVVSNDLMSEQAKDELNKSNNTNNYFIVRYMFNFQNK